MNTKSLLAILLLPLCSLLAATAPKLTPKQDMVEIPAMREGLCLHNLFQSNMVLQRDKPVAIWGWAAPGEEVTVSFGGQTQTVKAAGNRSWKVTLSAMPASAEPRSLTVKGKDKTLTLENIVVGDIWVLGGQSNMEFEITKVDNGDLEIVSANFPNIRLMSIPQQNGPEPKQDFPRQYQWIDFFSEHYRQGYWDVCTPETVREMSGIGYVYARRIHMATQIPIGVIDASRGGTSLETWTPLEVLKATDTPEVKASLSEWDQKVAAFDPKKDLENRVKNFEARTVRMKAEGKAIPADRTAPTDLQPGPALDMNRPGNCYASMIAPMAGFAVKGAIWHQGYNNAMQPNGGAMYHQLFAKMIGAWRAAFNDPQMPFGIISLCTEGEPQDLDNYLEKMNNEGIYIREVQYQTFLDLQKAGDKNIGYASSFDQRRSWYHPQIKIPVGERISRWALATQYGKHDLRWLPPTLKAMRVENGSILLTLDSWAGAYNDGPILGFAIAGEDGHFQPAKAEWLNKNAGKSGEPNWERSVIVLSSPLVPAPVQFRHAWGRNPLANLKSADITGIPLATIRSDKWSLADMYEIYTGKKTATPGVLRRDEQNNLQAALKAADVNRRAGAAREFLEQHPIP